MALDFTTLNSMRQHNPAWRLLCSDHAPLILSFLHQVFVRPHEIGTASCRERA